MPTKAVYLPGVGAKQFRTRVRKKVFEVGPKKEECEKVVGAKQFRTCVRKKFFGRFAPAPTLVNPVYAQVLTQNILI